MQPEIFLSVPLHDHAATPGQVKASEGAEEMDFGRVFARQSADEMRRETPKTVAAPTDKRTPVAEGEAEDAEVLADEDTPPDEAEAVPDETAQPERPAPGLTADVKGHTGEPAAMAGADSGHADSGHGDATSMGPIKAQGVDRFGANQQVTAQESPFVPDQFASELLGERRAEVPHTVSLETQDTIGASHARKELFAGQAPMVAPPGPRRETEAGKFEPRIDKAMYRNRIGSGANRESATQAGELDFTNSGAPESKSGLTGQPEITTIDSKRHAGRTYDRAQPLEIAGVEPEAGADHLGRLPAEMAAMPTARREPTSARQDMPESPGSLWPFPASQMRGAFAGMENSRMNPRYEGHTVRGEQVVQDHDRLIGTVVSPPRTERKGLASTMQTATSVGISDSAINPATWPPVPADAVSADLSTIPAPGGHELRFSPTYVDLPAMTAVPVASSRLSEGLNVAASEEPDFRPGLTRHAVPTQATLNTAEGSEAQFSEPARTRLGTVQLSEDAVRQQSASLADRDPLSGVNSSANRSDPAQLRLAATDATEQKAGMRKAEPEGQRVVLSDRDRFGLVRGQNGAQPTRSFENSSIASFGALRKAGAGDGTEAFLMAGREQAPEVTSVIGRPDAGQVRVGATGVTEEEATAKTGPELQRVMPAGGNSFGVKTGQSGTIPIRSVETAPRPDPAAARNAGVVAGTTPPAMVTTGDPAVETSGRLEEPPGTKVPGLSLSDSGGVTIPLAVTTVRGSEPAAQPFADPPNGQPAEMARVLTPTHDGLRPPQSAGAGPAEDVGNSRVLTSVLETHETGRDRRLGPAEIGSHGFGPRNVTATDAERLSSEPGLMEQQLSAHRSGTLSRDEGAERWLGGRETARSRPSPALGVGEPSPLASTRAEEPGHSRHPDRLDAGRALPPETASPQMARSDAVTKPTLASTEIPQAQDGAVNKMVSAPADLAMPRFAPETMGHVPRDIPPMGDPQAPPPAQHAALARDVAQQLSQVTRSLPGEVTELTLRPEELGQVRMRLSGSDGQIVLQILSERPETHDLMRRHIEIVERAFRDLGYQDIAFEFSFSGQRGREPQSPREPTAPEDRQVAELPPAPRAARGQMLVPGRLDIRL
ncbi:MAG: hypothetical protein EP318_12505 [Rhodobacteraceae bacterium]|nr:MAG: hypothetical protein EP318_12505 [Paracoccaceae bacterium]